jgi:hypothetical protein
MARDPADFNPLEEGVRTADAPTLVKGTGRAATSSTASRRSCIRNWLQG